MPLSTVWTHLDGKLDCLGDEGEGQQICGASQVHIQIHMWRLPW